MSAIIGSGYNSYSKKLALNNGNVYCTATSSTKLMTWFTDGGYNTRPSGVTNNTTTAKGTHVMPAGNAMLNRY